jgi:hypothetical protein
MTNLLKFISKKNSTKKNQYIKQEETLQPITHLGEKVLFDPSTLLFFYLFIILIIFVIIVLI